MTMCGAENYLLHTVKDVNGAKSGKKTFTSSASNTKELTDHGFMNDGSVTLFRWIPLHVCENLTSGV